MAGDVLFREAKNEAAAIIRNLHITKPEQIEVETIAAYYDVFPREDILEGSDARIQIHGNRAIITTKAGGIEVGRKRFSIAHELGHFFLHRRTATRNCTQADFLIWYKESVEEPQANVFAAELLMPEHIFMPLISGRQPSFEAIKELALLFRTSLTATAFRFVEVSAVPCALVCVQNAKIAWRCWSSNFHHRILGRGADVDRNCYAGSHFLDGSRPEETAHAISPLVWLENADIVKGYKLYEQSVCMPNYGIVLTLIWISR